MDTACDYSKRAPPQVDHSTAAMDMVKSTVVIDSVPAPPGGYYSVVDDVAIVGRRSRLPPRIDHRRQEGSLRTATCFWVSMLIAGIVLTSGFSITVLAHAKCIDVPEVRYGLVTMLFAACYALVAVVFRVIRVC
ncbi:hypothetical protein MTO96_038621 [Rhipicephalus appendiculatus]